jgi:HrpA-like RNA helicase
MHAAAAGARVPPPALRRAARAGGGAPPPAGARAAAPAPPGGGGGGGGGAGGGRRRDGPSAGALARAPRLAPALEAAMRRDDELLSAAAARRAAELERGGGGDYARLARVRATLPVAAFRADVVAALASSQVVLLSGGTGCGKTTQVPQFILEDAIARGAGGRTRIICTQPRRIAATGVAARVAAERGEPLGAAGGAVGYHIKGERRAHAGTALLFCTTGILLRRLAGGLGHCTHIIVDEVHERSVDTDFLLAVLRRVLPARPDVKVLLMSATMDAGAFATYFARRGAPPVPVLDVPGFAHPVRDVYLEDVLALTGYRPALARGDAGADAPLDLRAWKSHGLDIGLVAATVAMLVAGSGGVAADAPARAVDAALGAADAGAILVFLPGVAEIRRVARELERGGAAGRMHVLQLHGQLSPAEQARVFERPPRGLRKVVLSTNVAETSLTIDDVTVVVDTCRVKESAYDALNDVGRLAETWTSQASAKQRRGRAGRTRPGVNYRLIPRAMHDFLAPTTTPEICRAACEDVVLQVLALRLGPVADFMRSLLDAPPPAALASALCSLAALGATVPAPGGDVELSPLGVHLARLGLPAHLGKALVYGALLRCLDPLLTIVAALADRSPFRPPPHGADDDARAAADAARAAFAWGQSDHLAAVRAYDAWAAAGGEGDRRRFADAHGLSHETLRGMEATRREHGAALRELGLAPRGDAAANANAAQVNVVRAALVAGLGASRLVKVVTPARRYNATLSGAVRADFKAQEVRFYTLHPEADAAGSERGRAAVAAASAARAARAAREARDAARAAARSRRAARDAAAAADASGTSSGSSSDDDGDGLEEDDAPGAEAAALEVRAPSGAVPSATAIVWRGFLQDRVFLHPASFNFRVGEYRCGWLVYHEKHATTRVFIRDSSVVTPFALALFGGPLAVHHAEAKVSVGARGWVRLRAEPRVGVLAKALRAALDALLAAKISDPALDISASPLVDAITRLLVHNGY